MPPHESIHPHTLDVVSSARFPRGSPAKRATQRFLTTGRMNNIVFNILTTAIAKHQISIKELQKNSEEMAVRLLDPQVTLSDRDRAELQDTLDSNDAMIAELFERLDALRAAVAGYRIR